MFGAFPVQGSELVSIWNRDIPKRYFLKVQGEKSFATGMQEVDASNHDKVRAEIVALVVNKRLLLVKTPPDNQQLQFTGTLTAVPTQADAKSSYPHASCIGPLTPDDLLEEFLRLGCSA